MRDSLERSREFLHGIYEPKVMPDLEEPTLPITPCTSTHIVYKMFLR